MKNIKNKKLSFIANGKELKNVRVADYKGRVTYLATGISDFGGPGSWRSFTHTEREDGTLAKSEGVAYFAKDKEYINLGHTLYNEQELVTEIKEWHGCYKRIQYDNLGRKIKFSNLDAEENIITYTTYKYSNCGNFVYETRFGLNGAVTELTNKITINIYGNEKVEMWEMVK
jgi:hypothetical protein